MSEAAKAAGPVRAAGVPHARWLRIGSLLFFTYLVAYVDRTNISVAAPAMKEDLGITQGQVGVLLSAFFWGYVVSLAVAGFVVRRFGAKRTIIAALIVFGLASAATGLVTDMTHLVLVRVVLGLGEGMVFPAFTVFFVNWFPSWERGRASMFSLLTIPISAMIMSPLSGWMINNWSYREMFVFQGLPPLLAAVLFWWLAANAPEKDRRISDGERDFILANRARGEEENGNYRDVFLNPQVWVFAVIYLLWAIGLYGFGQWLPTLIKQLSGENIEVVGWLTVIPYAAAAVVMFFNAKLSDRSPTNRTFFIAVPMLVAGAALLASRLAGGNFVTSMIVLSVACIGVHAPFGPWWAWVLTFVPRNMAGQTSGTVLALGNFGGIIGPIMVGLLANGEGVSTGYYVLGYALIAAGVLAALQGITARRSARISAATAALAEAPVDLHLAEGRR